MNETKKKQQQFLIYVILFPKIVFYKPKELFSLEKGHFYVNKMHLCLFFIQFLLPIGHKFIITRLFLNCRHLLRSLDQIYTLKIQGLLSIFFLILNYLCDHLRYLMTSASYQQVKDLSQHLSLTMDLIYQILYDLRQGFKMQFLGLISLMELMSNISYLRIIKLVAVHLNSFMQFYFFNPLTQYMLQMKSKNYYGISQNFCPSGCSYFGNDLCCLFFRKIVTNCLPQIWKLHWTELFLKPEDQMPYQVMQVARKASQQSQALRRELRNTMKRAKQDLQKKHEQTIKNFESKLSDQASTQLFDQKRIEKNKQNIETKQQSGASTMFELEIQRQQIISKKKTKKQARRFFQQL